MSRRRRRAKDPWESLISGLVGFIALAALAIGGVHRFVPTLLGLVLVIVALVAAVGLGICVVKLVRLQRANRALEPEPTAPAGVNAPPASAEPAASPARPAASAPDPVTRRRWDRETAVTALAELDWYQFEKACAALLRAEGHDVERRGGAQADGGVDLVASRGPETILVQCKHWRSWEVQEKVVREMLGSMTHHGVARGAICTLKGGTRPAKRCKRPAGYPVAVWR